jgi:general secretion pathway protein D
LTADKAAEFGIQWQALGNLGGGSGPIGGTNFNRGQGGNIIDGSANLGSLREGLNIGVVKGQVTLPGIGTVANIVALARALEADTNANILATPNLLTLDNEESKIVIGQNIPILTGQYAQTGSTATVTPFQTIERKDIGLTLRVKPQISEGGTVRLQIFQEVSSIQSVTNVAGVILNKRSIESTVLVDDGQMIVLGGLIQDSISTNTEKVPLLGDLPLLGALFRYDTRKQTKTNLMVFLRPVVLRDSADSNAVTAERYRRMQGVEDKSQIPPRILLPDMPGQRMPPLEPAAPAAK